MPRFSVIVPAYNVQAYLRECLDSVRAQSFRDFELIVVDDCSPDCCGAIVDEAAGQDSRITAVHLGENAGLGRARNAGMHYASGDYLLFLDGDDTLTPGSLQAIDDRLDTAGEPDLLLYDYARTYWYGRTERNARAALLSQQGPDVFTLADRPQLLTLLGAVWNKAYKREFTEKHGFTFPPGFYEDVPWSYPALMAARSLAVLDRVCVHYRQRRDGSILGTTSRRHFDIFEQYERVFTFFDDHPETARWKPFLYRRMVDHLTTVHNTPGRLPPGTHAEFFRRSRDHARRFLPEDPLAAQGPAPSAAQKPAEGVPEGAPVPRRRTKLRLRLVHLGAGRTFRLLWKADQFRKRLRKRTAERYGRARKAALRLHYAVQRLRPVDKDLAVFAAYWNRGYSCNPAAIEAKVRELAPHVRTAWITTPEYAHTLPAGVRRLQPGSREYWTALARGKFFVSNVNFPGTYVKRRRQVHLQTHHGSPVKHMGLDLRDYPAGAAGTDFGRLLRSVDRWDFSLSSNRHSTVAWQHAYPADYETLEYGYPRNDVLHTATSEDIARIRGELGIPGGATAVLYAPTHRDYRRGYVPRLEPARVARELGPGFVLLVRPHYFYGRDETGALPAGVIDVSRHPSVEELCLAADVLVTDYSSIMFDYAELGRPVVVHADDWETYRAARGTYFDLMETPPGLIARSEDELIDIFSTGAWQGPHTDRLRTEFRERFPSYDDGHAAERVVRRVFLAEETPAPGDEDPGAGTDGQALPGDALPPEEEAPVAPR